MEKGMMFLLPRPSVETMKSDAGKISGGKICMALLAVSTKTSTIFLYYL